MCCSLKICISILAIIDGLQGIFIVGYFGFVLGLGIFEWEADSKPEAAAVKTFFVIVCVIFIVAGIIQIGLAIYLRIAAKNENQGHCLVWLLINAVSVIVGLVGLIWEFLTVKNPDIIKFSCGIGGIVYKIFEMLVVYCFMQNLKQNRVVVAITKQHVHHPHQTKKPVPYSKA